MIVASRFVAGLLGVLLSGKAAAQLDDADLDGPLLPSRSWGNVSGILVDDWGVPAESVRLRILGTEFDDTTSTGLDGRFLFSGLRVPFAGDSATLIPLSDAHYPSIRLFVPPGALLSPEVRLAPGPWIPEVVTVVPSPGSPTFAVAARSLAASVPWQGPWTVFATREGLVGYTTANGHVITAADHFVALPSKRALNATDTARDFLVELTGASRTVVVPVLDVGPWNTKDDWWHDTLRETFSDLERGLPEAVAAFRDGYNGGRDGMGREVLNEAGIDLADGVFWDDLGLVNNGPISVRLLWKLDASKGDRVRLKQWANVRASAAGNLLFQASCGESGTIVGAPAGGVSGGRWYLYWPVAWDRGTTGWVVENFVTRDTVSVGCADPSAASRPSAFSTWFDRSGLVVDPGGPRRVTVTVASPNGRILSRQSRLLGAGVSRFELSPARGLELVEIRSGSDLRVLRRMP